MGQDKDREMGEQGDQTGWETERPVMGKTS